MSPPTVTKVLSNMPRRTSGGFFIVCVEVNHNGKIYEAQADCPSMAYAMKIDVGYQFKPGTY